MKTIYAILILGSGMLAACSESTEKTTKETAQPLEGKWKLQKEERTSTREKGVPYADQPTYVILHIQKGGYFLIYDTFIDPSWKNKGLPMINERSHGQWKIEGKTLTLNHLKNDTSYMEKLQISQLDDQTLITQGSDRKSNVYKTYQK